MSHFDCRFLIASNVSGLFKFATCQSAMKVHKILKNRTQNPHEKGTQSRETRNASMKDCVSDPSRNFGTQHISKNQVILQPSPTLSKGSTHDHSTPRLQFPSLEFSSCTPWDAQFLRYEELDQAAVDLCVDISAR